MSESNSRVHAGLFLPMEVRLFILPLRQTQRRANGGPQQSQLSFEVYLLRGLLVVLWSPHTVTERVWTISQNER